MKVLLINTVCGVGSTGRICTDIVEDLSARGHDCRIAYGGGTVPGKFKKYAVKIGSDLDAKMHVIQSLLLDRHGFGSKKATEVFIRWVKEYNPDVIHLHNIHGYYINIEVLFSYLKTCGKKIFWTLHDCWAFTGHCAYFATVRCERWKTHCLRCVQDELRKEFDELVDQNSVMYVGWIKAEDSYKYFSAADLVVFPSRHSVFWEQVVGMGKPMVVKYWEGVTHINFNGNVEFLHEDSTEEIQKKIISLLDDPGKLKRMKDAACGEGRRIFLYSNIAKCSIT